MPEARDRLARWGTSDMALGFPIRRGFFVAAAPQPRVLYQSDNKENIPPESSRSRRRRTSKKKSPLPSWYPRTPLRDITAIVNAMERRRERLRAVAELRRRNQESAISSPSPLHTSTLAHELSDSDQSPTPIHDQEPPLSVSDLSPVPLDMLKNLPQPAEHPLEISPSMDNSASNEKNKVSADKILSDTIEEIERIVMENIQMMAKRTTKKSERSTLMSMR